MPSSKKKRPLIWSHKKFKGREFLGDYEIQKDGSTKFYLVSGKKTVKFRSWQKAKAEGWTN